MLAIEPAIAPADMDTGTVAPGLLTFPTAQIRG